jgi:GTPase KRas protein
MFPYPLPSLLHSIQSHIAPILTKLLQAGQEEYSAMRDQYMRHGQGFAIVYDMVNRSTFDEAYLFRTQITRAKDSDNIPLILIANKADLAQSRKVTTTEGMELAKSFGCKYIEASAKTRMNVDEAFYELVREIRKSLVTKDDKKKKAKKCLIL